jgi:hypothetical protein
MRERCNGARLLLKTTQPIRIGRHRARKDFDRDVALEPWVAGSIDLAHPAGTDPGKNLIRTKTSAWCQSHR